MATVKEVKITKDGAMVTPVVLIDSVRNLDGSKFKDSYEDFKNIFKYISNRFDFEFGRGKYENVSNPCLHTFTFPYSEMVGNYGTLKFNGSGEGMASDWWEYNDHLGDYAISFDINLTGLTFPYNYSSTKTFSNVVDGYDFLVTFSATFADPTRYNDYISNAKIKVKLVRNSFSSRIVDNKGKLITSSPSISESFECYPVYNSCVYVKTYYSGSGVIRDDYYLPRVALGESLVLNANTEYTYDVVDIMGGEASSAFLFEEIYHYFSATYTKA